MSWFGDLFKNAKAGRGDVFVFERVPLKNGGTELRPIATDDEYVTISVLSSRIVNVRQWAGKFHAAVHSRSSYNHERKGKVDLQSVLVPELMKDLDPANVDRVITVRLPILGPVVYRGGLTLEFGLFSVQGADLASPYIELLTSVAKAASPAFVAQAAPFAEPLREGCALLFGNKNRAELEIGLDITWNKAETGTWILMRAPTGTVPVQDLTLHPESFHLVGAGGEAYRDYPYVVLSIEASERRVDWMMIPELLQAWEALAEAAKAGEPDDKKVQSLLQRFNVVCRWSPDLVAKDAERLRQRAAQKVGDTGRLAVGTKPDWSFAALGLYID